MTAKRTAHPIALFRIARAPPRTASDPPCLPLAIDGLYHGPQHDTYGEETSYDGIPRVFFSSNAIRCEYRPFGIEAAFLPLHCAIVCRKKTSPHTKVAS
jgi:hypothetical protein